MDKINVYTPSDPSKITHEQHCTHISDSDEFSECDKFSEDENFSEQQHNTPREDDASPGVTAVAAMMMAEPIKSCSSKKVPTKKIIRVLLDSGSNGDLLFHKKGAAKQFPS